MHVHVHVVIYKINVTSLSLCTTQSNSKRCYLTLYNIIQSIFEENTLPSRRFYVYVRVGNKYAKSVFHHYRFYLVCL